MRLETVSVQLRSAWLAGTRRRSLTREYQQWRVRLIRQRFWLAVILIIVYWSIAGLADFYELFMSPEPFKETLRQNQQSELFEIVRRNFVAHKVALVLLLSGLVLLWKSVWGRRHPETMLVLLPWAVAFVPEMVLGAFFGIPRAPSTVMFMAQAIIAPVFWQLHLVAQLVPILFYFLVYPLLGLAVLGDRSIYSFSYTVEIILLCIVCEVGVYLYECSKQAELEANQRLQLCVHTITHDLRTPVMGSLMLLKTLSQASSSRQFVEIDKKDMAQIVRGSERLLKMMNSLLVPQAFSSAELALDCQFVKLSGLIETVLEGFQPALSKHRIQVNNQIREDLPLLYVDVQQVSRVFRNLIDNAISYNPVGTLLTLDATETASCVRVVVRDNGVGIPSVQEQTIFEPYTRGAQTQYLPGLGLGLYVCRQVVLAHGGTIEVESLVPGTAFCFTLPSKRKNDLNQ